jgi:hypothetical protein
LPVLENSIVFLPVVSPETLKPYSYASNFAAAVGSAAPSSLPSTVNEATPNLRPCPSF